jgi:hypothetical protein
MEQGTGGTAHEAVPPVPAVCTGTSPERPLRTAVRIRPFDIL